MGLRDRRQPNQRGNPVKDAQKPDHISLNNLIERLREGRFVVPDFQREFEWEPWDILQLVRSIFLDYYIGSLLFWKGKTESFDALACESLYGYPGNGEPEHIVLDGQQRLTAMYYVFHAPDTPLPNRTNRFFYFIRVDRFMAEDYDEAFEYDWKIRGHDLLADQNAQFESHLFPVSIVGQKGWELANWVQNYQKYWNQKADDARSQGELEAAQEAHRRARDAEAFGQHLKGITDKYQIAYIELDCDLEIEKVCDIFTQINSRGIRLDIFDLINALLKPKGLQLSSLGLVDICRAPAFSLVRKKRCAGQTAHYIMRCWSPIQRISSGAGGKPSRPSSARLIFCVTLKNTVSSLNSIFPTYRFFLPSRHSNRLSINFPISASSMRSASCATGTGPASSPNATPDP